MVFAGFFISSARFVSITVESGPPPDAVFVTGNFDVSSATLVYQDQLVVTPTDIEFKTDGTKLFVAVQGSSTIYEYSLSTAWDLTTIGSDSTASLSVSNVSQVNSIDFNRSGTKLYATGSGKLAEFGISSPYDLSTAGSQSTISITNRTNNDILGICFSNTSTNNYIHYTTGGITTFIDDPVLQLTYNQSTIGSDDIIPSGVSTSGISYTTATSISGRSNVGDYGGDGGSGYVSRVHTDIPGSGGWLSSITNFTFSFWIYLDRLPTGGDFMGIFETTGYPSNSTWILYFDSYNKFVFYHQTSSGSFVTRYNNSSVGLTTNTWYFITFTIDGTTGVTQLFVNGVNKPMTAAHESTLEMTSLSTTTNIGFTIGTGYLDYYDFDRYLDDFRIYDFAMTSTQAQSLYGSYSDELNYISTIEVKSPLTRSTFIGTSSNVLPLINTIVAPDLHTTRTLEVSGGGSRFYQIYRNTDLSNVYVIEYKLGTPHDASTLTSVTQIEDYFDLADQSGGIFYYDSTNSLKIKPDGTEMFLTGKPNFNNSLTVGGSSFNSVVNSTILASHNLKYAAMMDIGSTYGRMYFYEYDEDARTFNRIHTIIGDSTYRVNTGSGAITNDGTRFFVANRGTDRFQIWDYSGGTWSGSQEITGITGMSGYAIGFALSKDEKLAFLGAIKGTTSGYNNGIVYIFSEGAGGTWSLIQSVNNPETNAPGVDHYFGTTIGASDSCDRIVVPAMLDDNDGTDYGRAYSYSNVAGTWTLEQTISNPSSANTRFGFGPNSATLSADGTRLAIGSTYYPNSSSRYGRVEIFDHNGSSWVHTASIDSPSQTYSFFGNSSVLSKDGNTLCVGAPLYSSGIGRVYIFDYEGSTTWSLNTTIEAPNGAANGYFGDFGVRGEDSNKFITAQPRSTSTSYRRPVYIHSRNVNTQTYSLDIPDPYIHLTGNTSNTWDILAGNYNVDRSGTSEDFRRTDERVKTDTHSIACVNGDTKINDFSITQIDGNKDYFTVCGWVNTSGTNDGYISLFVTGSMETVSGDTSFLFAISTGSRNVTMWKWNGSGYSAYGTSALTSTTDELYNKWWHIAVIIPVSTYTSDTPVIFVNGEEYTTTHLNFNTWNALGSYTSGQDIFIGRYQANKTYTIYVDDFRWYNKKIDSKIIKKIYLEGVPPPISQVFQLTFTENTIPEGVTLGGTSLSVLTSNAIVHTSSNVAYFDETQEISISGWTDFSYKFSFSAWVYFQGPANVYQCILGSSGYSSSSGFRIYLYNTYLYIYFNNSASIYVRSEVHDWNDRWMHVCVAYDSPGTPSLYVNGKLQTPTISGSFSYTYNTSQTLYIGGTGNSQYYYKGLIEDLRIYDYALSPSEVEYIYVSTHTITNQSLYLSYDNSNIYDSLNSESNVAVTGSAQFVQNPGSKIGTHSGEYPQSTTGTLVPHWTGLTTASELVFSLWAFPTDLSGTHTLFCTSTGYASGTTGIGAVLVNVSGNLEVRIATKYSSAYRTKYVTLSNISNWENKWTHFVFVYTVNDAKIYINGERQTTANNGNWHFYGVPPLEQLRIGHFSEGSTTDQFSGAIDDFRLFFDKRLTDGDVLALYKQYTESIIYSRNITDTPIPSGIESPGMNSDTGVVDYVSYGWSSGAGFTAIADTVQSGNKYNVFDKNTGNYWQVQGNNHWIGLTYPYPVAINSYSFMRHTATNYFMKRWVLQGLNESTGWEDLENEHETYYYPNELEYAVSEGVNVERKKYRSYRIYIYEANGYVQLKEVGFYTESNVQPELSMNPGVMYNSSTTTYTLIGGYTNKPESVIQLYTTEDKNSSNLVAVGVARTTYPYKFASNAVVDSATFEYGLVYYDLTDTDNNVLTGNFTLEPVLENPDFDSTSSIVWNYMSSYGWPVDSGWSITQSSILNSTWNAWHIFSKSTSGWIPTQNALPAFVQITYPYAVVLKGYELEHYNNTNDLPTNWVIQGLEDDGTYSNLEPSRTISSTDRYISSVGQLYSGDVNPDNNSYSTYRFYATSYVGSYLRVRELYLYTSDTSSTSLRSNIGIIPEPGTDTLYVTGGHFTKPGSSISLYTSEVRDSSNLIATLTPSSQQSGNYFPAGDSFTYLGFDMSSTVYYTASDYYNNNSNGTFVPKIIKENPDFYQWNSLMGNYYTTYRWNAGTAAHDWRTYRSSVYGQYYVQQAFQKSTAEWISAQQLPGNPQWAYITYPYPVKVNHYMIEYSATNGRATEWVLQGSNDNGTWINVEPTRTNNAPPDTVLVSDGVNPDSNLYYSYRLYVTASNGGNWVRIRELRMYTTEDPPYLMGDPGFVPDTSGNVRVRCGFSSKPAQLYIYSDSEKNNLLVTLTSELFRPFHFTTAQQYADPIYTKGTTVYYTLTDYDGQSTTGTINTQPIKESPDFSQYNAIVSTGTTYWTTTSDWRAYTSSTVSGYTPQNAFDKSTNSWVSPSSTGTITPVWLDMIYPFAVKLKYAQFRFNGYNYNQNSPTYFKIQGSNDRANWSNVITVDYRTNGKAPHYETDPIYQNINPDSNAFSIYRMYVEDWNNRGSAYFYVQDAIYYTIDDLAPQLLIEPGFVLMSGSVRAIRSRTNKPGTFYYYSDSARTTLVKTAGTVSAHPYEDTSTSQWADANFTYDSTIYLRFIDSDNNVLDQDITPRVIRKNPTFTSTVVTNTTSYTFWPSNQNYDFAAFSSSQYDSVSYPNWKAFDNGDGAWLTQQNLTGPHWVGIRYPYAVKGYKYALKFPSDKSENCRLINFIMQGSNDGVNWSNLQNSTNTFEAPPPYLDNFVFDIDDTSNTYQSFRLFIEDFGGSAYIQLTELRIYTEDLPPTFQREPGFFLRSDGSTVNVNGGYVTKPCTLYVYSDSARTSLVFSVSTASSTYLENYRLNNTTFTDSNYSHGTTYYYTLEDSISAPLKTEGTFTSTDIRESPQFTTAGALTSYINYGWDDYSTGWVIRSSGYYLNNASYHHGRAFDKNRGSTYLSSNANNPWLEIEYPVSQYLRGFLLDIGSTNFMSEYKIQGSNDGSTYTDIESFSRILSPSSANGYYYWEFKDVDSSTAYTHFRMQATTVNNGSYAYIFEWKLFTSSSAP